MAPPPPKVTAAKPIIRNVTQWDEYIGHLDAVETVDVRAQVSGFVKSVLFTEGSIVHKGDLLLTIDPQIFQAQLDSANAALLEARAKLNVTKATLQLHENDLARLQAAGKTGSISVGELDTARFTVEQDKAVITQNEAAITGAEAAVKSAQQYVDWCKISAPITGRISSRQITEGNMLTGGAGTNTTIITKITTIDPIYCYVDVDEKAALRYQQIARPATQPSLPCYVGLDTEPGYPHTGKIDFFDNAINPATATLRVRGVFDNPQGLLKPGQNARVRLPGRDIPSALLVLNSAIGSDQDRKYIYILHDDKTVERRLVDVGPLQGELRVVSANLKPDESVIINGLSSLAMVRPGTPVDATTIAMPEHTLAMSPSEKPPATAASVSSDPSVPATAPNGSRMASSEAKQ